MLVHTYITVNEDEKKEHEKTGWKGDLADYAAYRFNQWKMERLNSARVITIETNSWISEIRPKQNNSDTWYDRKSIQLSVWMESDRPIPRKIKLTEKGREAFCDYRHEFVEKEFLWLIREPDSQGYVAVSTKPYPAPSGGAFSCEALVPLPNDSYIVIND